MFFLSKLFVFMTIFSPGHDLKMLNEDTVTPVNNPIDDILQSLVPAAAAPEVYCTPGKKCVVQYRLNGEIDEASTGAAIAWLKAAEEAHATDYVLILNTPGGGVDSAYDLKYEIENATIPVSCVSDIQASSAGFIIMQSCPVRLMTKRATLMTHEVAISGSMGGHPNDWQSIADMLKAVENALAEECNHRLTTSIEEYHRRTDGGKMWWFNWQDALKYHAIDRVITSTKDYLASLQ